MVNPFVAGLLLLAVAGSGAAIADDECDVPLGRWQPREAVQAMAQARGWQVDRLRIDDGCYQIRGTDETGQPFKAKIDPATLAIVKIKRRTRSDGGHRSERRSSAATGTADPSGPASPKPLFDRSEPPKATVK
ncbi:PepSY domain-containing protein [Bosea sp. (in: a-proteobacteria)]|uniref:PepSY domain-containing protein n=1 Tax=Bosea sp. (in: a-proteobacteria) TaxID=1871050 RepID=UPI002737572B|nr:PepSY domain-containing protein [Bosea sp. (in: a-proteobacteria)]MDP3410141.1 PepSY domain-containing protein [Bosea sp. (in: a-proteobacteria)]